MQNQAGIDKLANRRDWPNWRRSRALAATLCACTLLGFNAARAARLRPGYLQHVICKAPASIPTYSWLSDAPDFAVVIPVCGLRPRVSSAPMLPVLQVAAAAGRTEFSQYVRPPPSL